jgi:hypothetical protein
VFVIERHVGKLGVRILPTCRKSRVITLAIVHQNTLTFIFMNLLHYFVSNYLDYIFYLIPFIINLLFNHMHKQMYLKLLNQNN